MKILPSTLQIAAACILSFAAHAQKDLYFEQGPCMHELYYGHKTPQNFANYSDFHLQLNDSTILVASVMLSPESRTVLTSRPAEMLGCGNAAVSLTDLREVNAARKAAWWIEQTGPNTYHKYPVRELSLIVETPRYLKLSRARYSLYLDRVVPPAAQMIISSAESEVKTTFLGEVSFEFDGKEILGYIWDESDIARGGPVLNSTFFPGIGLYTSFGETDSLQLFLVNKQSLGEFLPDFAKGKVRLRNAQPQTPVPPVPPVVPPVPQPAQPEKPAETPATPPTPPVVQPQTPPTPEPARARQYVLDEKGYYTVQPGDNLYQICQGLQADLETVKRLNNFNGEGLRVGQKLLIKGNPVAVTPPAPPTPPTPPVAPAPAAIDGVHIVRAGENLYDIADRYGVSIGTLMTLNRLQAFDLTAGQQIVYREGAKPQKPVREARIGYHLVQPGETLSSIAQRYSTTPNELIAWNRLTDARIQEGQELRVQRPAPETPTAQPASAPKGFHLVQAGESLTDIAQRYRITPEDLIRWNELQQEPEAGQLLRIAAPTAASEPAPVKPTPAPPATTTTHTVQKGQTLSSIARQYALSVDALRKINRLTSDNLYVGQVLTLSAQTPPTSPPAEKPRTLPVPAEPTKPRPEAQPQGAYHAVQKGDNLNAIAKKYRTTPEALVKLNQLKNPNDIRIGQKLRVK